MRNEFRYDQYGVRDDLMKFVGYKLTYEYIVAIFIGLIVFFRILAFVCFSLMVRKF